MNISYTPSYEDPMYKKNFFDEYELECKYQEDFGAVLEPWKNQFPEPIEYSSKRSIWFRGDLYEFKEIGKEAKNLSIEDLAKIIINKKK